MYRGGEATEAPRDGAVDAARLFARFLVGGGAVLTSSSVATHLRLLLPFGCGGGTEGEAGRGGIGAVEAAGAVEAPRVVARFLDGRGAGASSSAAAARFRLPLLGTASSSKIFRGWRVRWPRPVASVGARSSTMSMARPFGMGSRRAARLTGAAAAVGGGGGGAAGARSAVDAPDDRAAGAATTPSGALFCPVFALLALSVAFVSFSGDFTLFPLPSSTLFSLSSKSFNVFSQSS